MFNLKVCSTIPIAIGRATFALCFDACLCMRFSQSGCKDTFIFLICEMFLQENLKSDRNIFCRLVNCL